MAAMAAISAAIPSLLNASLGSGNYVRTNGVGDCLIVTFSLLTTYCKLSVGIIFLTSTELKKMSKACITIAVAFGIGQLTSISVGLADLQQVSAQGEALPSASASCKCKVSPNPVFSC